MMTNCTLGQLEEYLFSEGTFTAVVMSVFPGTKIISNYVHFLKNVFYTILHDVVSILEYNFRRQ